MAFEEWMTDFQGVDWCTATYSDSDMRKAYEATPLDFDSAVELVMRLATEEGIKVKIDIKNPKYRQLSKMF